MPLPLGFEILVRHWRRRWDRDHVEFKVAGDVAAVAGFRQRFESGLEGGVVLAGNGLAETVERRIEHGQVRNFGAGGSQSFGAVELLADLVELETGQRPVLVAPGKPEFRMMHLHEAHPLAEAGLQGLQLRPERVDLRLLEQQLLAQRAVVGRRCTGEKGERKEEKELFHAPLM